jgi:hypothetical protein
LLQTLRVISKYRFLFNFSNYRFLLIFYFWPCIFATRRVDRRGPRMGGAKEGEEPRGEHRQPVHSKPLVEEPFHGPEHPAPVVQRGRVELRFRERLHFCVLFIDPDSIFFLLTLTLLRP